MLSFVLPLVVSTVGTRSRDPGRANTRHGRRPSNDGGAVNGGEWLEGGGPASVMYAMSLSIRSFDATSERTI